METAFLWGAQIPIGVLYEDTRPTYEARLAEEVRAGSVNPADKIKEIMLIHA